MGLIILLNETKNKEGIKKMRRVKRSSALSMMSAEKDLVSGMSSSLLRRRGLANSTLPGIKLAAAIPPMMERNENFSETIFSVIFCANTFQR